MSMAEKCETSKHTHTHTHNTHTHKYREREGEKQNDNGDVAVQRERHTYMLGIRVTNGNTSRNNIVVIKAHSRHARRIFENKRGRFGLPGADGVTAILGIRPSVNCLLLLSGDVIRCGRGAFLSPEHHDSQRHWSVPLSPPTAAAAIGRRDLHVEFCCWLWDDVTSAVTPGSVCFLFFRYFFVLSFFYILS